jgi:hypothetical protein
MIGIDLVLRCGALMYFQFLKGHCLDFAKNFLSLAKGAVSRDFRLQFVLQTTSPGPNSHTSRNDFKLF